MLASKCVVSFVARFVSPGFNTLSVLKIVFPHSFVLCAIDMFIHTGSICLIIGPETIVDVAINMNKLSLTMCPILSPFTNVLSTVRPGLLSVPITETAFPLSCVNGSCLELIRRPFLSRLIGVVQTFRHCLTSFFLCEILAWSKLFSLEQRNKSSASMTSPPGLYFDYIFEIAL